MKKNPLLSVIVPVYNSEIFLKRCIDSIISQTYTNLEIFLVDDGSTDSSRFICDEYSSRDKRIHVIHKENGGQNSARMAGLQKSSANYIAFVDSDDYIESNMYEEYMNIAINYNVDVVSGGKIRDYGTHFVLEPESIKPGLYKNEKMIYVRQNMIDVEHFFKYNISSHLTDKLYRRDLILKWLCRIPYDIRIAEDGAVLYTLIYDSTSVYFTGKNFYHYCIRPDSIMGMEPLGKNDSCYKMLDYLKHTLVEFEKWKDFEKQYHLLELYLLLLRNPESVLRYENDFLSPFGKVSKSDRIILYGAGKFGVVLKAFLKKNGFNIVAWVDNSCCRSDTITWEIAKKLTFDKIIISTLVYESTISILSGLMNAGVKLENILFVKAENIR